MPTFQDILDQALSNGFISFVISVDPLVQNGITTFVMTNEFGSATVQTKDGVMSVLSSIWSWPAANDKEDCCDHEKAVG